MIMDRIKFEMEMFRSVYEALYPSYYKKPDPARVSTISRKAHFIFRRVMVEFPDTVYPRVSSAFHHENEYCLIVWAVATNKLCVHLDPFEPGYTWWPVRVETDDHYTHSFTRHVEDISSQFSDDFVSHMQLIINVASIRDRLIASRGGHAST